MSYHEFLQKKNKEPKAIGFVPENMNPNLFDFQKKVVGDAINKGRYASFLDCGMGKTLIQLEIAEQFRKKTNKPIK